MADHLETSDLAPPAEPGEDAVVEIHKPKPWRGLREFLREYLIIVIGVLTALSAEAVVQTLHEHRLSAEAREAVRAEINLDLANLKLRTAIQPCIERRFAEMSDFISKAEAGQPFASPLTIGAPRGQIAYTERWDAATAGGRTSLLSTDEQRDLARVYTNLRLVNEYTLMETDAWSVLRGLEGVQHPSTDLLAQARSALGKAREADRRRRGSVARAEDRAREIGIKGEDPHLILTAPLDPDTFCLPISTLPSDRTAATPPGN